MRKTKKSGLIFESGDETWLEKNRINPGLWISFQSNVHSVD